MKLRALFSVAAVVAVGAVGVVSSAGAASAPTQYFTAAQTNVAGKTTVVAAGPISANGTDVESTRHLGTFTFPRGSLTVKHEATSRKDSFDSRTCVFTSIENGTYVIIKGTGAYTHVSGSGVYRATVIGQGCSHTQPPKSFSLVIEAHGPLSL